MKQRNKIEKMTSPTLSLSARALTSTREIARRADEFEARQKGKDKAQIANTPSGADEEAAAFAGNASTSIDHSHPCSPC